MGRESELMGRAFEQRVERDCKALPLWIKVPVERTRYGAEKARTWLDYVGCLPGGRMVTADAKWRPGARRITPSILKKHQCEWARHAHAAGALVVVIVGWLEDGRTVRQSVIPWTAVERGTDVAQWACDDLAACILEFA